MVEGELIFRQLIKEIPDFPKAGVRFKDINPLLRSPKALQEVCEAFGQKMNFDQIELVVGIESRGFILGMLLATHFEKGFVPLRKAGKLPPPVCKKNYSLEYGEAALECQPGQGKILIVDDVLATGGTLQAAIDLTQQAGYQVMDVAVLINLKFLNQMEFKGREITSLIEYT